MDDQIINQRNKRDRGEVQASKVRQEMKKRTRETEETPQQIISNAVAHLNDHAAVTMPAVTMPAVHHIRRDIRRQKKRAGNPITVPQDRFFDIPPEYQQTTAGKPSFSMTLVMGMIEYWSLQQMKISSFLPNPSRGLWMVLSKHHRNYSFRSTPSIAALQTEYCLCLCPSSQQTTSYLPPIIRNSEETPECLSTTGCYGRLRTCCPNAIDASFPDSRKKGCFFHFSQAIFRKIHSLGLQA